MWLRAPLALVLGAVVIGILGGLTGYFVQPREYTATAYAAVYLMPAGQQDLISPDEAYPLQSVYEAGALQDRVMAQVLPNFPGLTAAQLRRSVRIEIVAYSPFTRVIATTTDPRFSVILANDVSGKWTLLNAQLYNETFNNLRQALEGRKLSMDNQVAVLQQATTREQAAVPANPAALLSLQTTLAAAQSQEQSLASAISNLTTYHNHGLSADYTATPATLRAVTERPGLITSLLAGAALGLVSGVCLVLWRIRYLVVARGVRGQPS